MFLISRSHEACCTIWIYIQSALIRVSPETIHICPKQCFASSNVSEHVDAPTSRLLEMLHPLSHNEVFYDQTPSRCTTDHAAWCCCAFINDWILTLHKIDLQMIIKEDQNLMVSNIRHLHPNITYHINAGVMSLSFSLGKHIHKPPLNLSFLPLNKLIRSI